MELLEGVTPLLLGSHPVNRQNHVLRAGAHVFERPLVGRRSVALRKRTVP